MDNSGVLLLRYPVLVRAGISTGLTRPRSSLRDHQMPQRRAYREVSALFETEETPYKYGVSRYQTTRRRALRKLPEAD